jgi:DNA repair ATPase RecN
MKRIIWLLFPLLCITACNNNKDTKAKEADAPKSKADSLMADVMDGHDAGMARYGRLKSRKNEIQAAIDSLSKLPNSEQVAKLKQNFSVIASELNDAIAAMDKWMEEFNMDSAVNNMEQRVNYLMNEKLKVGRVKDAMMKGLQEADSALSSLKF